jgi:hypothetical protein
MGIQRLQPVSGGFDPHEGILSVINSELATVTLGGGAPRTLLSVTGKGILKKLSVTMLAPTTSFGISLVVDGVNLPLYITSSNAAKHAVHEGNSSFNSSRTAGTTVFRLDTEIAYNSSITVDMVNANTGGDITGILIINGINKLL